MGLGRDGSSQWILAGKLVYERDHQDLSLERESQAPLIGEGDLRINFRSTEN